MPTRLLLILATVTALAACDAPPVHCDDNLPIADHPVEYVCVYAADGAFVMMYEAYTEPCVQGFDVQTLLWRGKGGSREWHWLGPNQTVHGSTAPCK